jgi:hypothetical protein
MAFWIERAMPRDLGVRQHHEQRKFPLHPSNYRRFCFCRDSRQLKECAFVSHNMLTCIIWLIVAIPGAACWYVVRTEYLSRSARVRTVAPILDLAAAVFVIGLLCRQQQPDLPLKTNLSYLSPGLAPYYWVVISLELASSWAKRAALSCLG